MAKQFRIEIAEQRLGDMRDKIRATSWPGDVGNEDWNAGVPEAWLRDMAQWWVHDYNWRQREEAMNRFDHFRVLIEEQTIHFLMERGSGAHPAPLILTHGWPWSFWDYEKLIEPLAHPERFGGNAEDGFDVIVPSLPGYGFSSPLARAGIGPRDVGRMWDALMTQVLGYDSYFAAGGDWGAVITAELGHAYPERVRAIYTTSPMAPGLGNPLAIDPADFAEDEKWMIERNRESLAKIITHVTVHSNDPQTLAYALADSPVGTAAWLWERRRAWSDCGGDVETVFSRTALCDLASLYWLTNTIGSSLRIYVPHIRQGWPPLHDGKPSITVPTAYTVSPGDIVFRPRRLLEDAANVQHYEVLPRGGHFAAAEVPDLVIERIRSFFLPRR